MSDKANILLYGGTFDPIHKGHVEPVLQVANKLNVEQLIYMPCHIPPHKDGTKTAAKDRFAMTELAIKDAKRGLDLAFDISVSDYELTLEQASYSVKTIEAFIKRYPEHQLMFLIGMDSLLSFTSWYQWQTILTLCKLVVMPRPGYDIKDINPELTPYLETRILLMSSEQVNVSSTELRQSLKQDKQFLSASVADYIRHHDLY